MIVDWYRTKLFSLCRQCKKRNYKVPYSCQAYPRREGIPVEIWNAKILECPYFEKRDQQDN